MALKQVSCEAHISIVCEPNAFIWYVGYTLQAYDGVSSKPQQGESAIHKGLGGHRVELFIRYCE